MCFFGGEDAAAPLPPLKPPQQPLARPALPWQDPADGACTCSAPPLFSIGPSFPPLFSVFLNGDRAGASAQERLMHVHCAGFLGFLKAGEDRVTSLP